MVAILTGMVILFGVIPSIVIGTLYSLGIAVSWTILSHFMVGFSLYSFFIVISVLFRTTSQQLVISTIQTISKSINTGE